MFDVCMRLFCVCTALCVSSGLKTGLSLAQGVLPSVKYDDDDYYYYYCGVFTQRKTCNLEIRSRDYATVDEAVFSPCRAEPRSAVP
jgi:hypothetical protein